MFFRQFNSYLDGLVWLICKKPDLDKTTATTAIQTALGNNAQMKLEVENVRKLNANQSEVTMYVKEVKPDGSSKRVVSAILCQGLNQQVNPPQNSTNDVNIFSEYKKSVDNFHRIGRSNC